MKFSIHERKLNAKFILLAKCVSTDQHCHRKKLGKTRGKKRTKESINPIKKPVGNAAPNLHIYSRRSVNNFVKLNCL